MISGFTFVHNALDSGYPLFEAIRAVQPFVSEVVVVDMQSTDKTRETLEKVALRSQYPYKVSAGTLSYEYNCPIRIIDGFWGYDAGETLRQAHSMYNQCAGDIIIHFEADEVFDNRLLERIAELINEGHTDMAVYRLQLELNFQRCRWYPEPVHRVFPRFGRVIKEGHTTRLHGQAHVIPPEFGYLWDVTNCFRDNWFNRVDKQAELRQAPPQYIMTPIHTLHKSEMSQAEAQYTIQGGNFWKWKSTPFAIPEILKPLVGMTRYEPTV